MNDFAHLLDRLAYEPRRNAKLRLLQDYFAHAPDPERGWALAAMTGNLSFREAKPAMIRGLVEARVDPVLFALSHNYVGDLAETTALIWPAGDPPPPCGEELEVGVAGRPAAEPGGATPTLDPSPQGGGRGRPGLSDAVDRLCTEKTSDISGENGSRESGGQRGSPLLEGEGQGEVCGLSEEVTHLTPTLSFQERGPVAPVRRRFAPPGEAAQHRPQTGRTTRLRLAPNEAPR
jgi:DNA ligase-1